LASGERLDFLGWWVLLIRTPPTRMVLVTSALEEMTTGQESQQDYYEQGDRWEDGHRKSLNPKLAFAVGCLARTQQVLAVRCNKILNVHE
jgi:hypothetical protein